MKQRIGEIRTGMPGEIISFDAGTCMATVKPSLQYHTADGDILDYPLIIGVPVFMPHAGNAQITYPVKVGDSCWIAFAERSLDEWLGKSDSDNHDPRQYDLTDAVCFVGMRKVQSISADNVEIINGPTSISLTPDQKINIVGDVNIKGNISTIHSYNRRKVKEEDVPKYGKAVGTGTLVIGVSLVLSYLVTFWNADVIDYIVLPALVIGLSFILYGQIKYNHGIF